MAIEMYKEDNGVYEKNILASTAFHVDSKYVTNVLEFAFNDVWSLAAMFRHDNHVDIKAKLIDIQEHMED